MISIDPADMRRLENSDARACRVRRGGAFNAIFDVVDDKALDGQVLAFDVPFPYKGGYVMIKAGAFGDISNRPIGFRIDHLESMEVASTDDALELQIDDVGLQFRLDLSKCKNGYLVARMCEVDNRAAVSHGSDILQEHNEEIAGNSVRVVTRARLKELTLCKEGAAGLDAFAFVVDKTATQKPVAGSRSATFHAAQMLHKLSRSVKKLKASVVAACDQPPRSGPVRRTMTLDESNRFQTAETERLQDHARNMHRC